MNKKTVFSVIYFLIQHLILFANFDAKLLNYQPGARENVVVYYPIPYSSGYFSLYREEPLENKNVAIISHGYFGETLSRSFKNMMSAVLLDKDSYIRNFFTEKTNPYYFSLTQLNHLFRLYANDFKKTDGTPLYDVILGYGYSSIGRIKELGQRMSDTLTPLTSQANKVVHNAHSMGGLVSLWALTKTGVEGLGGKGKNQTLITYGSPLQGIAIGVNYNSILSHLKGHISITDMFTMTPYADDHERSDFLKELNDGLQGFEIGPNVFSDELLDGYCIAGSRYANLTQKDPNLGENPEDATYHIGDLIQDSQNALNSNGLYNKFKNIAKTINNFSKITSTGLNVQKIFDFLNQNHWNNDQWDALSDAEENFHFNTQVLDASHRRMGRHLSDGLVPLYSSASFPKTWCPDENSYHQSKKGKRYENMTQEERALYVDAMSQKSKSFREDRANHTFILHLNHRTLLGSDYHWDGDYTQPDIETILDQQGNIFSIEDPQWSLYQTLKKINIKIAEKDL